MDQRTKETLESARHQCKVHGVAWTPRLEAVIRNVIAGPLIELIAADEELVEVRRELQHARKAKNRCAQCGGEGNIGMVVCSLCRGTGER